MENYISDLSYQQQGIRRNIKKTSRYIGVYYENNSNKTQNKRWRAIIMLNDKEYSLGRYGTEEEAARAYNCKAIELYGKDAKLNIIKGDKNTKQPPLPLSSPPNNDKWLKKYNDISEADMTGEEKTYSINLTKENIKLILEMSFNEQKYYIGLLDKQPCVLSNQFSPEGAVHSRKCWIDSLSKRINLDRTLVKQMPDSKEVTL